MNTLLAIVFGIAMFLFTIPPWSIELASVPLQVILVWLVFGIQLLISTDFRSLILKVPLFIWSLLLVIFLSLLTKVISHGEPVLRLFQMLTGVLIFFLGFSVAEKARGLKVVISCILIAVGVSSLVAILQRLGLADWSWSRTLYRTSFSGQPSGLETFPVAFSYSVLPIAVICITTLIFESGKVGKRIFLYSKWIGIGVGMIAFFAVIVVQSRSGMVALLLVPFLLIMISLFKLKIKLGMLAVFSALAIPLFFLMSSPQEILEDIKDKFEKVEQDGRLTETWSRFIPLVLNKPMGYGEQTYDNMRHRLSNSDSAELARAFEQNSGYAPHNFLLTISIFYGLPAAFATLLLYLLFVKMAFSAATESFKMGYRDKAIFLYQLVGANLALFIHGWFHNASIVMGEMRSWIWLGFIMGLVYSKATQSVQSNYSPRIVNKFNFV